MFGPFDQRFVINNFIDNLTKVSGKHTFKFGLYYQRASNQSNSQTNVEAEHRLHGNSATNPLNTGYPFANALLGVYTGVHAGEQRSRSASYYLLRSLRLRAGHLEAWCRSLTLDLGFRLSHYEPYYNRLGEGAYFDPGAVRRRQGAADLSPGVRGPAVHRATTCARSIPPSPRRRRPRIPLGSFFVGKLRAPTPATSPTAWG